MPKPFYRVECFYGTGAYQTFCHAEIFEVKHERGHRPPPSFDKRLEPLWRKLGGVTIYYRFGFSSRTQMQKWFPIGTIKKMIRLAKEKKVEMFVAEYEVPTMLVGDRQAVAHMHDMKRIKRINLEDYLKTLK